MWSVCNNYFTVTFGDKLHIKMELNLSLSLKFVAALPCEI